MSIENLNKKLRGEMPITREELIKLIDSWGGDRVDDNNQYTTLNPKECYDLSKLDVSQITNMSGIFINSLFNGDISKWDTSNVTDMYCMFYRATNFNSSLPWNTSSVTTMVGMFYNAKNFNYPLSFETSMVTDMKCMLYGATNFNQPLNFDTSKVTNIEHMFAGAKNFNQPLNFNIDKACYLNYMFYEAKAFLDKYNNGKDIMNPKEWLEQNINRMKELITTTKLENNQKTFDDLIKEKNIKVDSPMYNSLFKLYNETQGKLKSDIEELKREVVEIATNNLEIN